MKSLNVALCLLSATASLAAPSPQLSSRQVFEYLGVAAPSVVKIHNISTNLNTFSDHTQTVRNGSLETSTLYEIPIPAAAAGRTCRLVIRASNVGSGDVVQGTQALDVFHNTFTDLADLDSGNLRGEEVARVVFNASTGNYDFDTTAFPPTVDGFPCPSGNYSLETVAVGDFDVNIFGQNFEDAHAPSEGLGIGYF
ncbi:hypothetical protein F5B20DRAFT_223280 [Whalleya microplaca]|nr:hypothetical protein F5B20DRAFT_223280 [Whalleya microplaca]